MRPSANDRQDTQAADLDMSGRAAEPSAGSPPDAVRLPHVRRAQSCL